MAATRLQLVFQSRLTVVELTLPSDVVTEIKAIDSDVSVNTMFAAPCRVDL